MFTGIIEALGRVVETRHEGTNLRLALTAPFLSELRVDQSLAHNGVCLTVDSLAEGHYTVVAIAETLQRTNLGSVTAGQTVNLERCLRADSRLDGHFVQGHVDAQGQVLEAIDVGGSWSYRIGYPAAYAPLVVEKGSVCINGVSLTVVEAGHAHLSVAIIPYTYHHTTFHALRVGDAVNLEFDILGKYLQRYVSLRER